MKKIFLAIALFIVCSSGVVRAQMVLGPEWGDTDEERKLMQRYMNFLNDNVKSGNYERAAFYLQGLIENAPKAVPNIYTCGVSMYRKRAVASENPEEKKIMIDSLLMMYDMHVENLGERYPAHIPGLLQNKAVDYRNLCSNDREGVAKYFREAIDALGVHANPLTIIAYFNELTVNCKTDVISIEDYIYEYDRLNEIMKNLTSPHAEEQRTQLERIFLSSGAANCDVIEILYGTLIDASPEDSVLLDKTVALLNYAKCTNTDFYMKVAELLYKVKPSANTALILSNAYKGKGDNSTSNRYLREALAITESPADKTELLISLAHSDLSNKNYRQAYIYANQALSISPQNVLANYIIALTYGNSPGACSDPFDQRTVYWLAVDNLQETRRLAIINQESGISVNEIDKMIARFRAQFPSTEELFFRALNEGDSYDVKCGWITGKTTVRQRP